MPIGERLILRAGTRVDYVQTDLLHLGLNTVIDPTIGGRYINTVGGSAFETQHFYLWSGFGSAEYKLCEELSLSSGYGFAQRPPTLTELYTGGAFFGLIQNGFNAIYGNPDLKEEQLHQFDVGINAKYERFCVPPVAFTPR